MDRASPIQTEPSKAEIVDFDEALLAAMPPERSAELLAEAALLAQAAPPDRGAAELEAVAQSLSAGERDSEMDRKRARGLAAALRRIARSRRS